VVSLSPQQYGQFYYLRAKHPQLNELNIMLDHTEQYKVLIEPGHTHVLFY